MTRIILAVAAALLMAGCNAAAQGRPSANSADIEISAQLDAAKAIAQRGDADMVLESLTPAMRDDIYPRLSQGKQYEVAELYGQAANGLGRWAEAHLGFLKASALPQATPEDWDLRMHSANAAGQAGDAWVSFDHLRSLRLPILETFGGRELQRFDALLGSLPNAREARLALGRQMEAEARDSRQGYNDESMVWAHFAEALLETGDIAHAKAALGRVTDPVVMTELAADRRFDAAVAANPTLADPGAAAERYLTWAQAEAQTEPRLLSARIAVIRALTLLDRPDEALAVAQETARTMARGTREASYFEDMAIEAAFFEGWKNSLLVRAGRGSEAIAGLTVAASCHCSEISLVQLGQTMLRTGHAKEAEAWLQDAKADRLAIEDQMDLAETRACVAAQLGNGKAVDENLVLLRAGRAAKPLGIVNALVCAGQLEEAASELQTQLADPRLRLSALKAVQVYADPDHQPFSTTLRGRWSDLLARPAVKQAIDKVGRSATFKLQARGALA